MAYEGSSAPSSGIFAAIRGALGLFDNLNKSSFVAEENNPFPLGEYESQLSDVRISELARSWKERYAPYYGEIEKSQRLSFRYWIGDQDTESIDQWEGKQAPVDNLIFEAIETFLPIATRANPDPIVSADPSDQAQSLAMDLRNALVFEADRQKLRLILKRVMRHWLIYRIGIVKFIWNPAINQIETLVVNPKRMIFDVDGYIDFDATFHGEYMGEKIREPAHKILEKFEKFLTPEKKQHILAKANGKMGTMLEYIEWTYRNTDIFYTMDEIVLGKFKNHMWNYSGTEKRLDPGTGEEVEEEIQGQNHLAAPSAYYRFLSVFSTGIQPHDETGLIMQNIGIQDLINRRWRQIDKNISRINNGLVVNGRSFSDEQASLAATALRKGTAIRVPNPSGTNLESDVMNFPAPGLNSSVFENMQDARGELKNVFGIGGSTAGSSGSKETARGQILTNQLDTSRIGGGIAEYLEQFSDAIYNYWVQIMFVYYDQPHYMSVAGLNGGKEMIQLTNARFGLTQTLDITVKDGSLIPKDPLTKRNEAIQLWGAQALDPRTLFQRLEFPDPNEATKQLILWQLIQKGDMAALSQYMPEFAQQAGPGEAQPGMGGPQMATPPGAGAEGPTVNPVGRPPTPETNQDKHTVPAATESQSKELMQSVTMPKL